MVEASDTYYGLGMLEKLSKGGGKLPDSFRSITGETVKHINRLVGTSIHHDTITGTSPSFVIQNETTTLRNREVQNSRTLIMQLKEIILSHKALSL